MNERLAAMREEGGEGGVKDVAEASEDTARKKQTQESKQRLARLNEEHRSDLTIIQLGGDDRENKRRVEEEDQHQELRGKLLAEAEHSARQNASVAMRWADLFSYEVPQELLEEIQKQRASCNMIIESKEQLIQEMKAELKGKDDDYVKSLKRQADDIDLMISHMSQQFKDMQKSYHEELIEIENAFLQERMETLSGNKGEMSQLFEKRNQREQQFMDMMLEQAENYQKQLEELRVIDAEDYAAAVAAAAAAAFFDAPTPHTLRARPRLTRPTNPRGLGRVGLGRVGLGRPGQTQGKRGGACSSRLVGVGADEGWQVTVELKNDLAITGTLHSVDQDLNIKLTHIKVSSEQKLRRREPDLHLLLGGRAKEGRVRGWEGRPPTRTPTAHTRPHTHNPAPGLGKAAAPPPGPRLRGARPAARTVVAVWRRPGPGGRRRRRRRPRRRPGGRPGRGRATWRRCGRRGRGLRRRGGRCCCCTGSARTRAGDRRRLEFSVAAL